MTGADITSRRHLVSIALRLGVILLLFLAARWTLYLIWWIFDSLSTASNVDDEGLASYGLTIGSYVVGAGVLVALETRIVRWVVPVPPVICPKCGYATSGSSSHRCPECGLQVRPLTLERESAPQGPSPGASS